ncbi:hypothetical protein CPB84DRAFT_1768697 [Gymnopilus junonius]|uniref:Uncharacterized protein n=1 Tax=Gymnopilus junonius TaxID=109634 RepID=A0A9P5NUK6_GYMJU|nr:hypothetical protein CPB84DRAFT_1768697 [Gymnopilus junonius]
MVVVMTVVVVVMMVMLVLLLLLLFLLLLLLLLGEELLRFLGGLLPLLCSLLSGLLVSLQLLLGAGSGLRSDRRSYSDRLGSSVEVVTVA